MPAVQNLAPSRRPGSSAPFDNAFVSGGALLWTNPLSCFFLGHLLICIFCDFSCVFAGALDGSPHIPARDGAVRAPAFAEGGEFARFWNGFLAVEDGETFLYAVIVYGQHVGATEAKNQEHLHGPGPDAAN